MDFNENDFLNVYSYKYDALEGIVFKPESGYKLKEEGF